MGDFVPGIRLKEGDAFEDGYRKFKKQVDRNLIITEARAKKFFESKVEIRKKQKLLARKKQLKRLYMIRRYESRL